MQCSLVVLSCSPEITCTKCENLFSIYIGYICTAWERRVCGNTLLAIVTFILIQLVVFSVFAGHCSQTTKR